MGVDDWSADADENLDIEGIDISEGCPAKNINNALRELMASVKAMAEGTSGDLDLKAEDDAVVHLDGRETIDGIKTFTQTITGSVSGSAGSAAKDGAGNVITDTYVPNSDTLTNEQIDSIAYVSEGDAAATALSVVEAMVEEARAAAAQASTYASGANSLANRVTALESSSASLSSSLSSLSGSLTSLAGRVTTLETKVAALEVAITDAQIDGLFA